MNRRPCGANVVSFVCVCTSKHRRNLYTSVRLLLIVFESRTRNNFHYVNWSGLLTRMRVCAKIIHWQVQYDKSNKDSSEDFITCWECHWLRLFQSLTLHHCCRVLEINSQEKPKKTGNSPYLYIMLLWGMHYRARTSSVSFFDTSPIDKFYSLFIHISIVQTSASILLLVYLFLYCHKPE